MDFEPIEGKYLAYPNNREIVILECENWAQRMTFTHSSVSIKIIYTNYDTLSTILLTYMNSKR